MSTERAFLAFIFRLRNFHSPQNLTPSVHCSESAQSEEGSENGSNLEEDLCDVLGKLSATGQCTTFP